MKAAKIAIAVAFTALLVMPLSGIEFGVWADRDTAEYYIRNAPGDTGSASVVNAILWDYRGFDTMGEEMVLFTAAMGVFLIMRRMHYGYYRKERE